MDLRLREKFGIGVSVGCRRGLVNELNDGVGTECGTGEREERRECVEGTLLKGVGHDVCADLAVAGEGKIEPFCAGTAYSSEKKSCASDFGVVWGALQTDELVS